LYKNSRQQAHLVTHLHFLPTRKPKKKMQKKYQATASRSLRIPVIWGSLSLLLITFNLSSLSGQSQPFQ
jgi:hypothetical protein